MPSKTHTHENDDSVNGKRRVKFKDEEDAASLKTSVKKTATKLKRAESKDAKATFVKGRKHSDPKVSKAEGKTVRNKTANGEATSVKRKRRSSAKAAKLDETSDEHAQMLGSITGQMDLPSVSEPQGEVSSDTEAQEGEPARGAENEPPSGSKVDKLSAAEYLTLWSERRKKWSFKKKTQYWLLQNMYDKKKVSKSNFKLMLKYLDGLRGNQRGVAKRRAEEVMAESEQDKDTVPESKVKYKRAVQVVRVLSKV